MCSPELRNPAPIPTGNANGVAWSPDTTYLAVAHTTSPFISVYKRSGDVLTKLSSPTSLPVQQGQAVAWSPDGVYLAVMNNLSPFMIVYKRSGDVFTPIATPTVLPTGNTFGTSFSPERGLLIGSCFHLAVCDDLFSVF